MNKEYHIALGQGDIGRYVLLPGDPGRCEEIAQHFDDAAFVAQNREYTTYRGTLLGRPVAVTSTGIGGPSTAIAVEELNRIGADTFIRVGTAGGVHPSVQRGELIVATGAVRDEGTSRQYAPLDFPAVAHPDVVVALRAAAAESGGRFRLGITHSKDSFYGEVEMERMPCHAQLGQRWVAWTRMGVLCSEMEAAALFVVSQFLGCRAGAIMQVISPAPQVTTEAERMEGESNWLTQGHPSTAPVVETAVAALKQLIQNDLQSAG